MFYCKKRYRNIKYYINSFKDTFGRTKTMNYLHHLMEHSNFGADYSNTVNACNQ